MIFRKKKPEPEPEKTEKRFAVIGSEEVAEGLTEEEALELRYKMQIERVKSEAEAKRQVVDEYLREARENFVNTGEGLPGWISVHRRGSLNTVQIREIRNFFPYEIVTEEGRTVTRIAYLCGSVLDVDETPEEIREKIWRSVNGCPEGDGMGSGFPWGAVWKI